MKIPTITMTEIVLPKLSLPKLGWPSWLTPDLSGMVVRRLERQIGECYGDLQSRITDVQVRSDELFANIALPLEDVEKKLEKHAARVEVEAKRIEILSDHQEQLRQQMQWGNGKLVQRIEKIEERLTKAGL